jgi:serine/threonine protein phosphatase 1
MIFDWFRRRSPAPHYPTLAPGEVVYAVGDLHGRSDLLATLQRAIDRLAANRGEAAPVEVYLGDYVDRGPDSRGVVELLMERSQSREVVALRGNHEHMLLSVLAGTTSPQPWLQHGGRAAIASWGIDPASIDPTDDEDFRDRLRAAIPPAQMAFLEAMPTIHRHGPYVFAHAGIRPGVAPERQKDEDLMWIRERFLDDDRDHGFVVVHGHTPVYEPEFRPNRMNLDTGAYLTGVLTCVRFDNRGPSVLTW